MYDYPPQDLHITLVTLAVPLAVVSVLLALALLWQTWTQYRLRRAGRLGEDSWWLSFTAVLLSAGHMLLLVGYYSIVALRMRSGLDQDLVLNPRLCTPLRYPQPCDPTGWDIAAMNAVRMMWTLLVAASIWCVLSVWVLIVGIRATGAGRRMGQGQNGQQGAVHDGSDTGSQYTKKDHPMTSTKVMLLGVLMLGSGLALPSQNVWDVVSRTMGPALVQSVNDNVNVGVIAFALMVLGVVVGVAGCLKT